MTEIEGKFPNLYQFNSYKDPGTTGRFEVTLYKNSKDDSGEGELIHSKEASGAFPSADWATFLTMLEESTK